MSALGEDAELRPGQRVTVHLSAYSASASALKAEIIRVFGGTIFAVDDVSIGSMSIVAGMFAMTGVLKSQPGLTSTLPGQNIRVSQFREFCNSRLNLASGALGLEASEVMDGGMGSAAAEAISSAATTAKPYLIVAGILVILAVLGYAAFGASRLVRG